MFKTLRRIDALKKGLSFLICWGGKEKVMKNNFSTLGNLWNEQYTECSLYEQYTECSLYISLWVMLKIMKPAKNSISGTFILL